MLSTQVVFLIRDVFYVIIVGPSDVLIALAATELSCVLLRDIFRLLLDWKWRLLLPCEQLLLRQAVGCYLYSTLAFSAVLQATTLVEQSGSFPC